MPATEVKDCLVVADLGCVNRETVGFRCRHKFSAALKEVYEFDSGKVFRRTGAEFLVRPKAFNDSIDEFLLRGITVALHHVEYFMSVCHVVLRFLLVFFSTL